mmetsp:Transcript_9515/g.29348  ORF Transcript_9515/g.29348 Transcript_9515/m.29348 type:complete len:580 (-) Transcript_9515:86-1825(-)
MSLFQSMNEGYDMMVDVIIRPPRAEYSVSELGPKSFKFGSRRFQRTDIQITNKRGHILECSHFEPEDSERPREKLPCVIYMHGNCGCRLEAFDAVQRLLPYNITVFAFDFSGCGLSEGEYISLGYFEREDVEAVVSYLDTRGLTSGIGLWGRSMGAATALMYSKRGSEMVRCMVLDSPFASLTQLARELCENNGEVKVPSLVVTVGLRMVRKSINKKAGFDLAKVAPIDYVKKSKKSPIPALFAHGREDTFIRPHHSEQIAKKHPGDNNLILVDGDHNSPRPEFYYDSVSIFLSNHLLVGEDQFDPVAYEAAGSGKVSFRQASYAAANPLDMYSGEVPLHGGMPLAAFDGQADEAMIQEALLKSMQSADASLLGMGDVVGDDVADEDLMRLIQQMELNHGADAPVSVTSSSSSSAAPHHSDIDSFTYITESPSGILTTLQPAVVVPPPESVQVAPPGALSDAIPDDMSVDEIMALFEKQEELRASQEAPTPATTTTTTAASSSSRSASSSDAALSSASSSYVTATDEPPDSDLLDPLIEMPLHPHSSSHRSSAGGKKKSSSKKGKKSSSTSARSSSGKD